MINIFHTEGIVNYLRGSWTENKRNNYNDL